jgi:hypothetical protein
MKEIVTIQPTSKRAKERTKLHGKDMELELSGLYNGVPAIMVKSLEKTWRCGGEDHHWGGWFTKDEIDIDATLDTRKEIP